jgi:GMP synthase PP-ATPase subunit
MFKLSVIRNEAGEVSGTWVHAIGFGYAVWCNGEVTEDQIDTVDEIGVVFRAEVDESEVIEAQVA